MAGMLAGAGAGEDFAAPLAEALGALGPLVLEGVAVAPVEPGVSAGRDDEL